MKVETASRLTQVGLEITANLNEMAREIQASEPEDEFKRFRSAVARVIGAIYFEILEPTWKEPQALFPLTDRAIRGCSISCGEVARIACSCRLSGRN
jgi:hypothetical protein